MNRQGGQETAQEQAPGVNAARQQDFELVRRPGLCAVTVAANLDVSQAAAPRNLLLLFPLQCDPSLLRAFGAHLPRQRHHWQGFDGLGWG